MFLVGVKQFVYIASFQVMVALRETGCGIGYGTLQTIDTVSKSSKAIVWRKARERYHDASQTAQSDKFNAESVDIFAVTGKSIASAFIKIARCLPAEALAKPFWEDVSPLMYSMSSSF